MPSFGAASQQRLGTCTQDLQDVCNRAIKTYDFSVLEGYRTNIRQKELFRQGKSKLRAGESKHNNSPSFAVDIAPYPIDWDNTARFYLLAGVMFQAAKDLDVDLRWGGDWDRDWVHTDQTFHDLPHFEVMI